MGLGAAAKGAYIGAGEDRDGESGRYQDQNEETITIPHGNACQANLFRQFVTEAPHCFYQIAGRTEFCAELGNISINRASVAGVGITPDNPQKVFPAMDLSQFFGKGDEKIVFYGGELYLFIADNNQVPVGI